MNKTYTVQVPFSAPRVYHMGENRHTGVTFGHEGYWTRSDYVVAIEREGDWEAVDLQRGVSMGVYLRSAGPDDYSTWYRPFRKQKRINNFTVPWPRLCPVCTRRGEHTVAMHRLGVRFGAWLRDQVDLAIAAAVISGKDTKDAAKRVYDAWAHEDGNNWNPAAIEADASL